MLENFKSVIAEPRQTWNRDRWLRMSADLLLLAAFVMTSSWLAGR